MFLDFNNLNISNNLNAQISEAQKQIDNITNSIQSQINDLLSQIDLLKSQKEATATTTQIQLTAASNYDIIGYQAPPNAQNMARYREIPIYGYRTPATYTTVTNYDPQYDTAITQIQNQIEELKNQLTTNTKPFLDSIQSFQSQLDTLVKDTALTENIATSPQTKLPIQSLIILGILAFTVLKK